eukprot:jgi/Bigna1/69035/fgenesh1_pg.7_\
MRTALEKADLLIDILIFFIRKLSKQLEKNLSQDEKRPSKVVSSKRGVPATTLELFSIGCRSSSSSSKVLTLFHLTLQEEFKSSGSSEPQPCKRNESTVDQDKAVLAQRQLEQRWIKIMQDNDEARNEEELAELALKGIPDSLRPRVWSWLLGADAKKRNSPNSYKKALEGTPDDKTKYVIDSDIVRTFPGDRRFHKGQQLYQRLRDVLYAFAVYDTEVRYTQGMNSVAAMLVMHIESNEDVFWMLERICYCPLINLSRLYGPGLTLVAEITYVFDRLLKQHRREIYRHHLSIARTLRLPSGFVGFIIPKFFFPIFTFLPLNVAQRIWDVMMVEGIVFLYKMGLFMLTRIHNIPGGGSINTDPLQKLMEGVHRVAEVDPIFSTPDKVIDLVKSFPPEKVELHRLEEMFKKEQHDRKNGLTSTFLVNNKSMLRVESFPSMRLFHQNIAARSTTAAPLRQSSPLATTSTSMTSKTTKKMATIPLRSNGWSQQKVVPFPTKTTKITSPTAAAAAAATAARKSPTVGGGRRSQLAIPQQQRRGGHYQQKLMRRPRSYGGAMHTTSMIHQTSFTAASILTRPRSALPRPDLNRSTSGEGSSHFFSTSRSSLQSRSLVFRSRSSSKNSFNSTASSVHLDDDEEKEEEEEEEGDNDRRQEGGEAGIKIQVDRKGSSSTSLFSSPGPLLPEEPPPIPRSMGGGGRRSNINRVRALMRTTAASTMPDKVDSTVKDRIATIKLMQNGKLRTNLAEL